MASPSIIDCEALLAPLNGGAKAGLNVQYGPTYRALKEAMRQEDEVTNGPIQSQGKNADWQKVIQLSTKILTEEGKDLGVMVWLVKALTKKHGFAGLRDGLKVMALAHEKCWTDLLPSIEDNGDLEARVSGLEGLHSLPVVIRTVPIMHHPGGVFYSIFDYDKRHDVERLKGAVQAAKTDEDRGFARASLEETIRLGEKIDQVVGATPLSHFSTLRDVICEAREAFQALDRTATEKYGMEGFTLRPLQEALEDCRDRLDELVRKRGGVGLEVNRVDELTHKEPVVTTISAEGLSLSEEMKTRAEAIKQLQRVAEFFRRTEPHSPVSYLVQRAARWGDMPLEEWLHEVIKNESVLSEVKETLGLAINPNTSQES